MQYRMDGELRLQNRVGLVMVGGRPVSISTRRCSQMRSTTWIQPASTQANGICTDTSCFERDLQDALLTTTSPSRFSQITRIMARRYHNDNISSRA